MHATVSIASTGTTSPVSEKRVSCTKVCTWPLTSATSPRYHRTTSRACPHAIKIASPPSSAHTSLPNLPPCYLPKDHHWPLPAYSCAGGDGLTALPRRGDEARADRERTKRW